MPELVLFHFPGACSRVAMTALEQVGLPYEDEAINLAQGRQHSPQFRAINPKGKIPALIVDGRLLGENAAILWWLDRAFPDAGLFPNAADAWTRTRQLCDLFWIASGWHPSVRANMMPIRWTTGDPEPVRERGRELLEPLLEQLDARLRRQQWWYGEEWSIIDTYFYWNYTTAQEGGYPLAGLEGIAGHRARVEAHPPFRRALAREQVARERLGNAA